VEAREGVSLGWRLGTSASGLNEAMLAASEKCSSTERSMRAREDEDEARGAAAGRNKAEGGGLEMLLLPRRWPRSSRLLFRSSGKRLVRVERRMTGGPSF
jgi:hypothetical protein